MTKQATPAKVRLTDGLGAWVPARERVPATGTECVVLLRSSLDRPPFVSVDTWDVQREDPTGMGGPTIETGEGWNDNHDSDVIAWIAIPPHPPEEWGVCSKGPHGPTSERLMRKFYGPPK